MRHKTLGQVGWLPASVALVLPAALGAAAIGAVLRPPVAPTARLTGEPAAMVAMRDGIRLATDVYRPAGDGPWPVILTRTPYGRQGAAGAARVAAALGYAAVVQDMRGRFDSEGENLPFIGCGWVEHADGADTVAWILGQPWCNGKVGTVGGSAGGITQNLMAAAAPEGLVCQYLVVAAANLYAEAAYVGGALRKEQVENWTRSNKFDPTAIEMWREHPAYDEFWHRFDSTRRREVMNVPAVHVGGWFDTFAQGTIDAFVNRHDHGAEGSRGRQKLVMGPWAHGAGGGGKCGDLVFRDGRPPPAYDQVLWFAAHLKGEATPILQAPAVAYYVMGDTEDPAAPGNEWRYADAWPVPATPTPYYLHRDGRLAAAKPAAGGPGPLEYVFDPADPCPTLGGRNLTIAKGPMNQNPVEGRRDVLNFTSEPLAAPLEVTGRVLAQVFVASDAVDTDLSVRLCDVYPDGRSYLMADGMRRLRFREGFERPVPLKPGQTYEVTVDCWSTSLIFNKGHRVRVTVTSSNHPRFDVNPGTGEPWRDGCKYVKQTNRVFCDAERSSRVLLPVVASGPAAAGRARP